MLKMLVTAAAVSVLLIGGAVAESPETSEDCFKTADEVADAVEEVQLTEEEMEQVDEMLFTMEEHCEAQRFSEATEIAESVRAIVVARR